MRTVISMACLVPLVAFAAAPQDTSRADRVVESAATAQATSGNVESSDVVQIDAEHMDVERIVADALAANPDGEAARARLAAAEEIAPQLRALPDPRVRTGFYAVPFPSVDLLGSEVRLQLSQDLPYPGTLERRAAVATRESDRWRHVVQDVDVRIAAAARRAYYELYFAERAREIHHRHLDLVRELSAVTEERYATGSAPQENVLRSLQELTGLHAQLAEVDAGIASARATLNVVLHRSPTAPLGTPGSPPIVSQDLPDLDSFLARVEASPALAAAGAATEREQARVEAERHEARPDFTVMAEWWSGPDRMGGRLKRYALLGTMTLPWVNGGKYSAAVAEAAAGRRAAAAEYQSLLEEVRRDVTAAWHQVSATARVVELYETTLLPQAETTLAAARAAYETASTPFVSVIDAERDLLLYRLALARAEADHGVALADLAAALGAVRIPTQESLR